MPKHRHAGATNQAGRSSVTAGGLGPAARGVEGLGRSFGYGPRAFSATQIGSAQDHETSRIPPRQALRRRRSELQEAHPGRMRVAGAYG
jgi:hypothetical protein